MRERGGKPKRGGKPSFLTCDSSSQYSILHPLTLISPRDIEITFPEDTVLSPFTAHRIIHVLREQKTQLQTSQNTVHIPIGERNQCDIHRY
jgi:hypothetical protein